MRAIVFWFFIFVMLLWTAFVGSVTVSRIHPGGMHGEIAQQTLGIGVMVDLIMWAIVMMPLGICALLAKPKAG